MHRRVIGDLAVIMDAIPVIRPQDRAREGKGQVLGFDVESSTLRLSEDAAASSLAPGELVSLKGFGKKVAPLQVVSASGASVVVRPPVKPEEDADAGQPATLELAQPTAFRVVPKIDQSEIFQRVFEALGRGRAICIFPEGGSSDRTELLPLKAGVSVMALGAADRGTPVQVVPVGLNYTRGNRWRSRVVVDVGKPMPVDADTLKMYRDGKKREAYAEFLKAVEGGMRSVTLNAPDMRSLQMLRTMRRMYQGDIALTPKRYMELNRRFAGAFVKFRADEGFVQLAEDVHHYMNDVFRALLTDRQVAELPRTGRVSAVYSAMVRLVMDLVLIGLAFVFNVPNFVVFGPMLLRVDYVVRREKAKALAGSSVKIKADDVVSSQKVISSLIWLPITVVIWTVVPGALLGGLWPRELPVDWAPQAQPGTAAAWFFLNVPWIVPVALLVLMVPYGVAGIFIGEIAMRRVQRIPVHWWVMCSLGRSEEHSRIGRLRLRRKELTVRIQDYFQQTIIPTIPEWLNDPIIDFTLLRDHRRPSDVRIAKRLHPEESAAAVAAAQVRGTGEVVAVNPEFGAGAAPSAFEQLKSSMANMDAERVRIALGGLKQGMGDDE